MTDPMIYNVAGLLAGQLGESRHHQIEDEHIVIERFSFTQVAGSVRMLRTDKTILVNADIEAATKEICSRCLEPADVAVKVALEEEFNPINADLVDGSSEYSHHDDHGYDPALIIDRKNFLDLTEGLGQALISALPIAPLCKDECLGICATCTVNRTVNQCTSAQIPIDLRWDSLAKLLEQGAESVD